MQSNEIGKELIETRKHQNCLIKTIEFNKLVQGISASWVPSPDRSISEIENLEKKSESMPQDISIEILNVAIALRKKGKRERTIRRAVEKKFAIKII